MSTFNTQVGESADHGQSLEGLSGSRSEGGGDPNLRTVLLRSEEQLRWAVPKGNGAVGEMKGFLAVAGKAKVCQLEPPVIVDQQVGSLCRNAEQSRELQCCVEG